MSFEETVSALISKRKRQQRPGLQQLQKLDHHAGELLARQDERDAPVLPVSRSQKTIFHHYVARDFLLDLQLEVCWVSTPVG